MSDKTRVQFELPDSAFSRLERIKKATEASTHVEVFKNALKIYEELLNQQMQGNDLVFVDRITKKETIFRAL